MDGHDVVNVGTVCRGQRAAGWGLDDCWNLRVHIPLKPHSFILPSTCIPARTVCTYTYRCSGDQLGRTCDSLIKFSVIKRWSLNSCQLGKSTAMHTIVAMRDKLRVQHRIDDTMTRSRAQRHDDDCIIHVHSTPGYWHNNGPSIYHREAGCNRSCPSRLCAHIVGLQQARQVRDAYERR